MERRIKHRYMACIICAIAIVCAQAKASENWARTLTKSELPTAWRIPSPNSIQIQHYADGRKQCPIHFMTQQWELHPYPAYLVPPQLRLRHNLQHGKIELSWENHPFQKKLLLSAYSLLGEPVIQLEVEPQSNSILFDTNALISGIYVILLQTIDGKPIGQGRLVVTHPAPDMHGERRRPTS